MITNELQLWIDQNPLGALGGLISLSVLFFFIARFLLARGLMYISARTETKSDDIIVGELHPFRVAWLAPLLLIYSFAYLTNDYQKIVEKTTLFLILWLAAVTVNGLLDAANTLYERSPTYSGVSIQGYLDILKILIILVGIILSISLFTGESPIVLLSGLGAITAVLLLVFRDTILSLVASIQISSQDLIKEGDWIEVPSYGADGDVVNMSLHAIKIQNWDKTITVIPTYKINEVAYKNWRGMQESGGRRIKRSIHLDLGTIQFCDQEMLKRYRNVDILKAYIDEKINAIAAYEDDYDVEDIDFPLDGPNITNATIYRTYIEKYLHAHPDIHQEGLTFLIRELEPGRSGLPLQIYVFTKTTNWVEYENIQAEIFDHLLAAARYFDLRIFQEPTGTDFSQLVTY
jgi:miniconductance mechanosensitive channel